MATIDESVFSSVANSNYKANGEFGARFAMSLAEDSRHATNLLRENAIQSTNRFNSTMDAALGRLVKSLVEPDPEEAASIVKMDTGFDKSSQGMNLAAQLSQLSAAIAGIQQYVKTAQTTPPVTGQ